MKYTYSFSENRVYCMTYYAGKTIKGVAKRDPEDEFDIEVGKKLAKARCDVKLYKAKVKRKTERARIANEEFLKALQHLNNAQKYTDEAVNAYLECLKNLEELEKSLT